MEHAFFPMFVDISNKKIVVAGGGQVALRRVKTLLLFTEDILVIAPRINEELCALEREGQIRCKKRECRREDIKDADIVLAATDCRRVNDAIYAYCREQGILVNTADDKKKCDFYFPSVIQKAGVTIGVNSGGTSPATVKQVREQIENCLQETEF
ncbi:MAG: bifunctional precorrin-2 dehydrogenase/sirohydrochlorin ferrochelatase [Coprococcus sp.]|nr:bifunctional precorrin-2 dehydrogenase/sirohydrochlorin ferrochelatase [Coprococcus sp.]